MKYCFILNARKDKEFIHQALQRQLDAQPGMDYFLFHTACPKDATRFVREYCRTHPADEVCFVACGGDGTINEVANGLVGFEHKYLAVMAYGSGNDFVKYYRGANFRSVEALLKGTIHQIDILKIGDKYSLNVCNFGFESLVCSRANQLSAKGAWWPYRRGILWAVLHGMRSRISVTADGEKLNKSADILLGSLANCRYVGGEYCCAPRALNDDGLIELCLVHPISIFRFISVLPHYVKGTHLDVPKFRKFLEYRQVKHVELHAPKGMEICLDGELYPGTHFEIDIIEKAIHFIKPSEL
ncbi:MAG: hypothetical protein IIX29_06045 [Bacteroidales bacterium]|nr:hypothetical protein [Bacteroidales bacterium]MBO7270375.1 hypothetical protein [Bacteroidales bacterium]MBR0453485.1 hypothetical protein [Bacteroidales bacterium]